MQIFIDGTVVAYTVPNGGSASFPVNDGVHFIHVKVGKNESEKINFTAAQKTVSFVASVERVNLKKKVILSRSRVIDDTGETTGKEMQREFVPE
jgi:hypothetical protein